MSFFFNSSEFIEHWRKISVEGLDDKKICEFLDNQGHYGLMKNNSRPTHLPTKPSRRGGRRPDTMKHNLHVAHQLEVDRIKLIILLFFK